jgi:hypothetical protein
MAMPTESGREPSDIRRSPRVMALRRAEDVGQPARAAGCRKGGTALAASVELDATPSPKGSFWDVGVLGAEALRSDGPLPREKQPEGIELNLAKGAR